MDAAAHAYVQHATAYQQIIDKNGGDYNKAAVNDGPALLDCIGQDAGRLQEPSHERL